MTILITILITTAVIGVLFLLAVIAGALVKLDETTTKLVLHTMDVKAMLETTREENETNNR